MRRVASLFDIVNGFFNRCRGDMDRFPRSSDQGGGSVLYTNDYLAELNHHTVRTDFSASPVLSLVVWTLKREVRASGECLGMYRR